MSIDWSRPIEAVHKDGRVGDVNGPNKTISGMVAIVGEPHADAYMATFKDDGRSNDGHCPWTIRNVQPMHEKATEAGVDWGNPHGNTQPDLTARMEKLVRWLSDQPSGLMEWRANVEQFHEARAIVALLPPVVDADLVEARKIVAEAVAYGAGISSDPERPRPQDFRVGACDAGDLITRTLAAIRKGPTQNNR